MDRPIKPSGRRGVSYIRVSRDFQETTRQRDAIEGWLARLDLDIEHTFEDSGSRDMAYRRPDFVRLLKAVESGLVDWVVVDRQDRFGTKDAHEWGKFITLFKENGCELWSTDQGLLSADDDATVLTSTIGALTSTREQKEKAARSIKGKVVKARLGLYQGGYPPYGTDVACYDSRGEEKWRVLFVGHFKRIKILPDGSREVFDGKGNFPARDPHDELRLAPSVETRRIEVVQQIFEAYAGEAIALNALARRLNDLKIDPVFGDIWNQPKVKSVLENPVYLGMPAWNKRAGSRFVEYIDGQFREVPRTKGKAVTGRRREREDFVQGERPLFDPLVPREVWEKVQAKLNAAKDANEGRGAKKGPRSAELWLKGFLVCGRCGKPMRGWHPRKDKYLWKSYFCGTYGSYGPKNPTGCKLHRVKAELLEHVVDRYIEEKHTQLAAMVAAQEKGDLDLMRPLWEDLARKWDELKSLARRMQDDLTAKLGHSAMGHGLSAEESPDQVENLTSRLVGFDLYRTVWETFGRPIPPSSIPEVAEAEAAVRSSFWEAPADDDSLRDLWQVYQRHREPELAREIALAEDELARLVASYGSLPGNAGRARDLANARILKLEARLDLLKAREADIGQRWDELVAEIRQAWSSVRATRGALQGEGSLRRKAEQLGTVVDRIVCHFRYSDTKGKAPKSFLDHVEIIPVMGTPISYPMSSYPNSAWPGRG